MNSKNKKLRNFFLGTLIVSFISGFLGCKFWPDYNWIPLIGTVISFVPFMTYLCRSHDDDCKKYREDLIEKYKSKTDHQLISELENVKSNQEYFTLSGEIIIRFINKLSNEIRTKSDKNDV